MFHTFLSKIFLTYSCDKCPRCVFGFVIVKVLIDIFEATYYGHLNVFSTMIIMEKFTDKLIQMITFLILCVLYLNSRKLFIEVEVVLISFLNLIEAPMQLVPNN